MSKLHSEEIDAETSNICDSIRGNRTLQRSKESYRSCSGVVNGVVQQSILDMVWSSEMEASMIQARMRDGGDDVKI